MAVRKVVSIDEEKCDGCGFCASSCAEGAIQMIDGKARLVSDVYCDGLGACLDECPQGAITIIQRESAPFDEAAATRHIARLQNASKPSHATASGGVAARPTGQGDRADPTGHSQHGHGGCPGAAVRNLSLPVVAALPSGATGRGEGAGTGEPSGLGNWPVQLHLVPPSAPFLREADILLVADCVPFALADFHHRFLGRRPVVIGCPKLDDTQAYFQKLIDMLATAKPKSLTVVHMEVPCCTGLLKLAEAAIQATAANVPLEDVVVSIRGEVLGSRTVGAAR